MTQERSSQSERLGQYPHADAGSPPPGEGTLSQLRAEGNRHLSAMDRAIDGSLSRNAEDFMTSYRQDGGE